MRRLFCVLLCFGLGHSVHAQRIAVQAGAHMYPTGQIVYGGGSYGVSPHLDTSLNIGYNRARRQDFGEHDDERGDGLGLRMSGHYRFRPDGGSVVTGVDVDVWWLTIDWVDLPPTPTGPARAGQTDITVLQPTASLGYEWTFAQRLRVGLHVALGAEINVRTEGEAVGQGAILLGGLRLQMPLGR
ncbi:MAG: hypothetical protein RhofKO_18660 [Rhodothermales bacterium]